MLPFPPKNPDDIATLPPATGAAVRALMGYRRSLESRLHPGMAGALLQQEVLALAGEQGALLADGPLAGFELPRGPLAEMLDAATLPLLRPFTDTRAQLEQYLRTSGGAPFVLAAMIAGAPRDEAEAHLALGKAWAMAGVLGTLRARARAGICLLPMEELTAAGVEFRALAEGAMPATLGMMVADHARGAAERMASHREAAVAMVRSECRPWATQQVQRLEAHLQAVAKNPALAMTDGGATPWWRRLLGR